MDYATDGRKGSGYCGIRYCGIRLARSRSSTETASLRSRHGTIAARNPQGC